MAASAGRWWAFIGVDPPPQQARSETGATAAEARAAGMDTAVAVTATVVTRRQVWWVLIGVSLPPSGDAEFLAGGLHGGGGTAEAVAEVLLPAHPHRDADGVAVREVGDRVRQVADDGTTSAANGGGVFDVVGGHRSAP
jgi:hypothetical protein